MRARQEKFCRSFSWLSGVRMAAVSYTHLDVYKRQASKYPGLWVEAPNSSVSGVTPSASQSFITVSKLGIERQFSIWEM